VELGSGSPLCGSMEVLVVLIGGVDGWEAGWLIVPDREPSRLAVRGDGCSPGHSWAGLVRNGFC
jgi:hypothetical protein